MFKTGDIIQANQFLIDGKINKNEATHLVIDTLEKHLLTAKHCLGEFNGPKRSGIDFNELDSYTKVF